MLIKTCRDAGSQGYVNESVRSGPAYLQPFIHAALAACIPAHFDQYSQQMKSLMSYPHAADFQAYIHAYGPLNLWCFPASLAGRGILNCGPAMMPLYALGCLSAHLLACWLYLSMCGL